MDPNWFYSSASQCAAAGVGLLGAVLAARLQEQYLDVRSSYEEVARLIEELRGEVRARLNGVRAFGRFAERRVRELTEAREQGKASLPVTQELSFWGGETAGSPWPLSTDDTVLNKYRFLLEYVEPAIEQLQTHAGMPSMPAAAALSDALRKLETTLPHDLQGPMGELHRRLDELTEADAAHQRVASVRVPAVVTAILAWLSIFGTIVPLAYLSAHAGASKALLLGAFGLGVMAIPAYLGYELGRVFRLRRVVV